MASIPPDAVQRLTDLGLNRLEADVYVALLQSGKPMTGYAVAKMINKPTANVYKALDALIEQGAAVSVKADSRLCAAVPAAQFLKTRQQRFDAQIEQTGAVLQALETPPAYDGVYQLGTVELALTRARSMLQGAQKIALVDAFPAPLEQLHTEITAAAERGVNILLQAYDARYTDNTIPHIDTVQAFLSDRTLAIWPGHQLNIVVDGREVLLCFFSKDMQRVHQAVWSSSRYLASILLLGLRQEFFAHKMFAIRDRRDEAAMIDLISTWSVPKVSDVPGLAELLEAATDLD